MKHLFTILFAVVALSSNAQFIKKLSLDVSVGGRFAGAISDSSYASYTPGSDSVKAVLSPGIHVDGGLRYQLNELISLRGGISFDRFNTTISGFPDSTNDNSSLTSLSIESVINLKEFKFMSFIPEKMGLNFHGGFGLSFLSNTKFKEAKEFKGSDEMINIIFGLTPQYNLNDKISINLDMACRLLLLQSYYVNPNQDGTPPSKNMSNIFNLSVGATYRF